MIKHNAPDEISAQDKLSAIVWAAERKNMTYGKFCSNLSEVDEEKLYKEYLEYKKEKQKKSQHS